MVKYRANMNIVGSSIDICLIVLFILIKQCGAPNQSARGNIQYTFKYAFIVILQEAALDVNYILTRVYRLARL